MKKRGSTGGVFGRGDHFDISKRGFKFEFSYRTFRSLELRFRTGVWRNEDKITPRRGDVNIQGLSVVYSIFSRGRIEFSLDRAELSLHGVDITAPFELTDGNEPGVNLILNANLTYSLGRYVQLLGNYRGRLVSARIIHTAQLEVRAYF